MKSDERIHIKVESSNVVGSGISDPGLERDGNEDSISLDESGVYVLLADGMGGHERGAEASKTALDVIQEFFKPEVILSELPDITSGGGIPSEIACLLSLVDQAVNKANSELYRRNVEAKLHKYMGTTVVGLVMLKDYVLWFHVGDSRLYRWRNSILERLTTDHSAYFEWIRKGKSGVEPAKNIITRAVGPNAAVSANCDWDNRQKNDIYILCSDGLTDMISEGQIVDILTLEKNVDAVSIRLIDTANDAGGKDNVSVIVCRV